MKIFVGQQLKDRTLLNGKPKMLVYHTLFHFDSIPVKSTSEGKFWKKILHPEKTYTYFLKSIIAGVEN